MTRFLVRHKDLVEGILNSPTADPIALALSRTPGISNPVVGNVFVTYTEAVPQKDGSEVYVRLSAQMDETGRRLVRHLSYGSRFEASEWDGQWMKPISIGLFGHQEVR